ncbi:MAG: type II toxin-antitoxin system RelE/ParE family toxin [Methylococcaceae bacterium]
MPKTGWEMNMYLVELMPKAIKDLKGLPKSEAKKIVEKIRSLEQGLGSDIKKLTNFSPEYRLRVGSYRVLFEIENQKILIYRVKHRKEEYTQR